MHLWGFRHPLAWSLEHLLHVHCTCGMCGDLCSISLLAILIRCLTVSALCVVQRHSDWHCWYSLGGTLAWNHAGICFLSLQESLIGARARLVCFAVLKSVITLGGRCFAGLFWHACVWGWIDVRKMLTSRNDLIPSGLIQLMIASVVKAHCGQFWDVSRCDNFLPFSCLLSSYCSMTSLLLLCPVTQGDRSLLTCLPTLLFLFDLPSLVSYLVTGLSLPLTISLTIVMFPQYSTLFYDLPLR